MPQCTPRRDCMSKWHSCGERMADHAMQWEVRHALGGDMSAWDTSWPHCTKVLSTLSDRNFIHYIDYYYSHSGDSGNSAPKRTTPHLGVVHMAAGLSTSALGRVRKSKWRGTLVHPRHWNRPRLISEILLLAAAAYSKYNWLLHGSSCTCTFF